MSPYSIARLCVACFLAGIAGCQAIAKDSVSIEVVGSVEARCASSGFTHAVRVPDAGIAGTDSVRFEVDCNAPFQYSMVSQNGGFQLAQGKMPSDAWSDHVPYRVSMFIPLNADNTISDSCTSQQIKHRAVTCRFSHSGNAVAIRKTAAMHISWETSKQPLIAGVYEDRLIVTLAIRL